MVSVLVGGEEGGEEGGAGFDELLLGGSEGVGEVAFDVEFAGELFVDENGDDNFRLDHGGAGEIAGIGGDILNNDDFTAGGRGAAQAVTEGDADVGSEAADVGPDDEVAGVRGSTR